MREDDFNLIYQSWIRVRKKDATLDEVSILELFQNAHHYYSLAGELPTQDAAILRMLLAIMHTVFSRVASDGAPAPLDEMPKQESRKASLGRWTYLWEQGHFPMEPIEKYLRSVEDRFWLFDREHPFYQVPSAKRIAGLNIKNELKCKATKLNATINQSENKGRIFLDRSGEEKESLSYAEAARWLIHMVAYDDCAVRKSDEFKKSGRQESEAPGVGWLGKLGLVYAEGDNLFETLVLNMVMWPNGKAEPFQKESPLWEQDTLPGLEREKIPQPENMAQLLTFPSRYILLEKENGRVPGAYPLFGVFFDSDYPLEQMTRRMGKSNAEHPYEPLKHDTEVFLWQEFDSLFAVGMEEDDSRPGIVRWINKLQDRESGLNQERVIRFCSVGMFYDKSSGSITQVESDHLSIHINLILDIGAQWRQVISEELFDINKVANAVGQLARDIYISASGRKMKKRAVSDPVFRAQSRGMARIYEAMDLPFRDWLRSISADDPNTEEKRAQWRKQVLKTARRIGRNLVEEAGPAAYTGHLVREKDGKEDKFYSSAKAYAKFEQRLYFYQMKEGRSG